MKFSLLLILCFQFLSIEVMESLGPKRRSDIALIPDIGWAIGYGLVPWIAIWLKNFRYMQLLNSAIIFVLLIALYWFDESPRWQIAKCRFDEAERTIKKVMRMNGKSEERFEERIDQLKQNIMKVRNKSFSHSINLSSLSLSFSLYPSSVLSQLNKRKNSKDTRQY